MLAVNIGHNSLQVGVLAILPVLHAVDVVP